MVGVSIASDRETAAAAWPAAPGPVSSLRERAGLGTVGDAGPASCEGGADDGRCGPDRAKPGLAPARAGAMLRELV
jgi:hypothetical protein